MNLFLLPLLFSQWGPAGCGPVGPLVLPYSLPVAQTPVYRGWHPTRDDADFLVFFNADGDLTAGWRKSTQQYWDYKDGQWVKGVPAWKKIEGLPDFAINGVDLSRLSPQEECRINGRKTSKQQMFEAMVGGKSLEDDSGKPHLTIVGSEPDRQKVLSDLDRAPELAEFKDKFHVQAYPPDHWALKCGFATTGTPTIYLQAADGKVLFRQDGYQDGPRPLAVALRK